MTETKVRHYTIEDVVLARPLSVAEKDVLDYFSFGLQVVLAHELSIELACFLLLIMRLNDIAQSSVIVEPTIHISQYQNVDVVSMMSNSMMMRN